MYGYLNREVDPLMIYNRPNLSRKTLLVVFIHNSLPVTDQIGQTYYIYVISLYLFGGY